MRALSLILLFFMTIIAFSCDASSENDYYKFIVTSMTDSTYGYYILDDEDPVSFTASQDESGIFWTYSKNLSTPQSITIRAYGYEESTAIGDYTPTATTTNISIDIYENNKKVKSVSGSKDIDVSLSVEVDYEFASDDDDSSTTTTDTTSSSSSK